MTFAQSISTKSLFCWVFAEYSRSQVSDVNIAALDRAQSEITDLWWWLNRFFVSFFIFVLIGIARHIVNQAELI